MGQELNTVVPKTIVSGQSVAAIVPKDLDEAYRLAKWYSAGNLTPKGIQTPEAIMSVMLMAMEVGMSPMMGLQSIAVINGRPSLWGDGLLGLVMSNPMFEDIEEIVESGVATCTIWRKGKKTPVKRTFTLEDAKLAGLLSKDGPWKTYPQRMLQMRARAWAIRDCFPDVLRGMSSAEEQQDVVSASLEQSAPPPPQEDEPVTSDQKALPGLQSEVTTGEPEVATVNVSNDDALAELDRALAELDKVDEVFAMLPAHLDSLNLTQADEATVEAMVDRHVKRITGDKDVTETISDDEAPFPEEDEVEDPLLRDAYCAGYIAIRRAVPKAYCISDEIKAAFIEGFTDHTDGLVSKYAP